MRVGWEGNMGGYYGRVLWEGNILGYASALHLVFNRRTALYIDGYSLTQIYGHSNLSLGYSTYVLLKRNSKRHCPGGVCGWIGHGVMCNVHQLVLLLLCACINYIK